MDQGALVTSHVDEGEALINRLAMDGVQVVSACWVKAAEEEGFYLYIATPPLGVIWLVRAARRRFAA